MIKRKNVLEKYNLPKEIKYCKKCTMSNQRPRISFNEDGICSACQFSEYKNNIIDWLEREKELVELCKKFKRKDGGYDVIVPSSGGKDSSFVAHQLKYKYGMNVLTVTWSPHLYTDIGWKNFRNMINVGGLNNILGTPNGIVHRKLTKLAFEILGDPFQPFIYGQTNFPLQIATKYKIPLIMYGENGEVEYGGDMKNANKATRNYKTDHDKHYFSGIPPEKLTEYGVQYKDLSAYLTPPINLLNDIGVEIHFYSYYKKWIPKNNYYYATKNTGFSVNLNRSEGTYSKYASLDDKIDGFHFYLSYIKFGIGRATNDSAHEIRDALLTREEGIKLIEKFDGEFPQKYFKEFLEYCDISEEYFWRVINSWRSEHIWKKINNEWKLRHTVFGGGVDD